MAIKPGANFLFSGQPANCAGIARSRLFMFPA
jgi:hypothetical protein